jgi:hypothetical protein
VLLVLAIRTYARRAAAQRAVHDAKLRAMAQTYLAAARKKKAAEKAAGIPAVPPAPPPRDERDCPFCAEPILQRARVCKHCGRDVEPLA